MPEVFDCSAADGLALGVAAAALAVRDGQVVVLPTDTVYGIGCDAFDSSAVAAVLAAKGRGREMPPPVLVPGVRTIDGLAREVPDYARALIDRFWPGALTLVLRAQSSLQWDLGDTNGTVAVRMPDDPVALALLNEIGPMAVTSANRTGMPPATTAAEAQSPSTRCSKDSTVKSSIQPRPVVPISRMFSLSKAPVRSSSATRILASSSGSTTSRVGAA